MGAIRATRSLRLSREFYPMSWVCSKFQAGRLRV